MPFSDFVTSTLKRLCPDRLGLAVVALAWICSLSLSALAQVNTDDHSAHHPAPSPAQAPVSPSAPGLSTVPPGGGSSAATGCMGMGCMSAPRKAFYPWLMDMPRLTPEARQFIEEEAQRRLSSGTDAIGKGQASLHHAMAEKDPAALQAAAASIREALQDVESGTAALRVLKGGAEPRQIALAWFREQTGVTQQDTAASPGPFGWAWYHLIAMVFLGAFVLGSLLIQFRRMRRISELTARLASRPAGSTAPSPAAPPAGGIAGPLGPPSSPAGSDVVASSAKNGAAAAQPLEKAASAIARSSRWSGPLRVAGIFQETHDLKTLRMVSPDGGTLPFTFLPGQFLTFSVEIEGKRVRRSYTIASSPAATAYVEVTVKRQEHHGVSAFLHDRVTVGTLLDISATAGRFTFTGEEDSIVLIAGGVGITPMMSVIRYLTDVSFPGEIFLLLGARSTEDFIFRDELEYLQRRHENLHIAATMSRAAGTAWMGSEGPISKEFIAQAVPGIARRHVHLCGPPPMMEAVRAELTELGVPKARIETEAFGPAEGMIPHDALQTDILEGKIAPVANEPANAATSPAAKKGNGAAPVTDTAQVRFTVSKKTGALLPDQSVLEAAEAIAVDIDWSCRVGTCGTCRVRLLEGAVTMEVEDGLQLGDKERGIILACQAKSTGNLVVEA